MFGLMDVLMFHPSSDQLWYVLYWLVKTYCWTFATTLCRFIIQWSFVTSAFFDFVTIHHPSQWWKNTQQNGMSRPSIIDPSYSITMKSPKNHHEKITMKPPGMKPAWKNHLLDHPMKPAFFPSPMIQWSSEPSDPRLRGFAHLGFTSFAFAPVTCGSMLSVVTEAQFCKFPVVGVLADHHRWMASNIYGIYIWYIYI